MSLTYASRCPEVFFDASPLLQAFRYEGNDCGEVRSLREVPLTLMDFRYGLAECHSLFNIMREQNKMSE